MAIPGLPALPGGVIFDTVQLLVQDALSLLGGVGATQWGLFLDGEPAVIADNVLAFDFRQGYRDSTFPTEEGSFETYNKVQLPYDVKLTFSTGGSIADRQELQDSIDAIIGSLDSFTAVTPEKVYVQLNPIGQNLRRQARAGVGLLVIDVECKQIRVTAQQQFASSQQQTADGTTTTTSMTIKSVGGVAINQPQSPSAAPTVSDGTVQPFAPTTAQAASFSERFGF